MGASDFELRQDVEAELDWDTRLDSRQIGVAVKDGVVALSGYVDSYAQQRAAQEAAYSIAGVRAVANDIVVEPPDSPGRSDAEIAVSAVAALKAHVAIPADRIKVSVRDAWLTLSGEVDTWFQKQAAEAALTGLRGVKGISDSITIGSKVSASDVQAKIGEALRRRAQLDAHKISVIVNGSMVTLEGQVHCWLERERAETVAWQAPGVTSVIDNLIVRP